MRAGPLAAMRLAPLSGLAFQESLFVRDLRCLVHCALLASQVNHPIKSWMMALQGILDELKDLGPVPNEAAVSKSGEQQS
jgi:hypothetical protein